MFENKENLQPPLPVEDLSDLYENAPCGYLSMLLDGRIFKANATLAAWTGYSVEQLLDMRFQELLTVGTRILYETSYAPLLSLNGAFDEIALDLKPVNQGNMAVLAAGRQVQPGVGEHYVRITLFRGTNRRLYERQLVDAKEQSQKLERVTQDLLTTERETAELREQFIAVLGHDLRNPLASISGGARLLSKEQPPERRAMLLDMLQSSVQRMAGLIDNVLDFARGRLGDGLNLNVQTDVKLAPVIEHVVDELRVGVPDRVIETSFDLTEPVSCDVSRLSQLASNLIGNALTHGAAEAPVRVHAAIVSRDFVLWVANGGAPIPQEAMSRLFHPFFRGEVRSSQQGLGLGLHIASEIAKAHGGTLSVVSTEEETRFTFRMPRTSQQAIGAEPTS